jgi:acyl carrier protein
MTDDDIRAAVLRALAEIVPNADLTALRPDLDLRDQLDIDSMDFLNLAIAIDQDLGVDIPESAYDRLGTLDDFVRYVGDRTSVG